VRCIEAATHSLDGLGFQTVDRIAKQNLCCKGSQALSSHPFGLRGGPQKDSSPVSGCVCVWREHTRARETQRPVEFWSDERRPSCAYTTTLTQKRLVLPAQPQSPCFFSFLSFVVSVGSASSRTLIIPVVIDQNPSSLPLCVFDWSDILFLLFNQHHQPLLPPLPPIKIQPTKPPAHSPSIGRPIDPHSLQSPRAAAAAAEQQADPASSSSR
jgi:hypothetical protein